MSDDNELNEAEQNQSIIDKSKVTQSLVYKTTVEYVWKPFDFLFPAGKLAKLVRIYDSEAKIPYIDIMSKLKISEGFPVVNMIGTKDVGRSKFYAGIARAAFNVDAIIVDSGISTGIEKYTIRRGVKLIGVAPENQIKFPKINPTNIDPQELSNGHTHLFLINSPEEELQWTQEALFKVELCKKISEGVPNIKKKLRCKVVHVLMADTPYYIEEVRLAIKYNQPIIVVKGSPICNAVISFIKAQMQGEEGQQEPVEGEEQQQPENEAELDEEFKEILPKGKFFILDSQDSEDIAQYIHFLLTITPWETEEDIEAKLRARQAIDHDNLWVQQQPEEG